MILFLVDMPNPTHGMSSINQQMLQRCQKNGVNVELINTVPSFAARLFHSRWWFVVKLFYTVVVWFRLLLCLVSKRPALVYRSLNGGIGQVFDLCFLLLLRFSRAQVVLHHHSFSYLRQPSALFKWVLRLLKSDARHIVLGSPMLSQLEKLYQVPAHSVYVLSNLSFFNQQRQDSEIQRQSISTENTTLKIGHLANLSFEKGLREFIDVVIALDNMGVAVQAILAGPCSSPEVADYVAMQTAKYPFIKAIGSVYGGAKHRFFGGLDLFLFPSKYVNEAEPLVLFEAAQHGVALAGTDRGCMAEQIHMFDGLCFSEVTSAADIASEIAALNCSGLFDDDKKIGRRSVFDAVQEQSGQRLQQLVGYLRAGYVPESTNV